MYNYAFFSRILAIAFFFIVLFLCLVPTLIHFRLKDRVTRAQTSLQNASRYQMVMNNLVPELARYAQRDPSILPLLQKYGMVGQPPASAPAEPQPQAPAKPKRK